jgi:hypothetical protein
MNEFSISSYTSRSPQRGQNMISPQSEILVAASTNKKASSLVGFVLALIIFATMHNHPFKLSSF